MKNKLFIWWTGRIALALLSGVVVSHGAESNALRIAIGPFIAPPGNNELRQAGQILPELLVAELSHLARFQLVERQKAESVWREHNVGASGLVARDTVAKLGRVLECDWLVSGSIVQAGQRSYVWTKVIDVRTGVVIDVNALPYESGDLSDIVSKVAAFLEKVEASSEPRQFITMGAFRVLNPQPESKREDWSRRLPALIERHFLENGFGVVEIAAVGPIFEERRLEAAGLTGRPDGRVKLQQAFWLVDGAYEWLEGQANKLEIQLRVQRVGGPAQMFRLADVPGEAIEKNVLRTIAAALENTNGIVQSGTDAEADLLAARGMEHATLSFPFHSNSARKAPRQKTQWDTYKEALEHEKQIRENLREMIATYERTLLQDPSNREAKYMLGMALVSDPDRAVRERGREWLIEAFDLKNPTNAAVAKNILEMADARERNAQNQEPLQRPDDWASVNQAYNENPDDPVAKCDLASKLVTLSNANDRERGRKLLTEVAGSDHPDQSPRARRILAESQKYFIATSDSAPRSDAGQDRKQIAP
ncbi:MAG TPA: CsgG/HfaB family protein [Verrucomicrobiota bacterium]|nr:CsgG/HfaB family protein [Verrucomicrobiota bacterium]